VTPPLLAAALALATVATAAALGSLLAALGLRLLGAGPVLRLGARTRASLLAQFRLAPAILLLPVAAVVQVAFWRFEPAHGGERVGPLLSFLAGAGVLLVVGSSVRWLGALRATRRLRRHWRAAGRRVEVPGWPGHAYRVEADFPVVAVVGMWRPELFVASRVAAACTPGEIAVVAAHERAHVAARDNLLRAAFAVTPLPESLAAPLERAWAAAAEEAADLAARAGGSGVTLASALLKVAGLAMPPMPPQAVLASALIGAGGLEPRVRRLLAPAPALGRAAWWVSAALTAGLVAASSPALPQVYRAAEFVVGFGR
jgi:Zn-dependent protease with chaperone function